MAVIQGEKLSNIYPHRKSISFILDYAFWICIGFNETRRGPEKPEKVGLHGRRSFIRPRSSFDVRLKPISPIISVNFESKDEASFTEIINENGLLRLILIELL